VISIRNITAQITIGLLDLAAFSAAQKLEVKREQENAGTRYLLEKMFGATDFNLLYTPENKPFFENNSCCVSISHSHDKLVIILNKLESTGIDIELIRDKVLKIQHKFLNDKEMAFAKNDVEKLIAIWAAKESIYKWYGLKNLDFKSNISVEDFDSEFIFGKIEKVDVKMRFQLVKEKIEDYMLVYILKTQAD